MMNIIDIIAIIPYFITLATVVAEGKEQDWYQRCVYWKTFLRYTSVLLDDTNLQLVAICVALVTSYQNILTSHKINNLQKKT